MEILKNYFWSYEYENNEILSNYENFKIDQLPIISKNFNTTKYTRGT